jgi:hypothetical protein
MLEKKSGVDSLRRFNLAMVFPFDRGAFTLIIFDVFRRIHSHSSTRSSDV